LQKDWWRKRSKLKRRIVYVGQAVLTTKSYNAKAIKGLRKVWKPKKGVKTRNIGENFFLFAFTVCLDGVG
jgi:hypothetical protein